MKTPLLIIFNLILLCQLSAQNMVINPDAESLSRGTGWTIVKEGALTCTASPTSNYLNWTMKPDGTSNYPFDHTTGASGGTVFYSGCDTYFQGPFELKQSVDVSGDAAIIDVGNQLYTFSGYMQTPVSNQTDQGRFVVDFQNASNTILGTSYTTSWQSYFGGSGTSWIYYSNTRLAPVGTRKVTIRLQSQILFNQPAINVHFDDIALTKPTILPLGIISFTGKAADGFIQLNWTMESELNCKQFELEQCTDAIHFKTIATIPAGKTTYHFDDKNNNDGINRYYRLKITANDGKITFSKVLVVTTGNQQAFTIFPNPAINNITVNGLLQNGMIALINSNGSIVLTAKTNTPSKNLNITGLPAGLYIIRISNQKNIVNKKLIIGVK